MARKENPQKKKESAASLRLQNPSLGAGFEIQLPRGWRVTKARASKKPRVKKMVRQKRRKR